jgi:hypothetical protein
LRKLIGRLQVLTDLDVPGDPLDAVDAALAAGAPVIQVRAKAVTDRELFALAEAVVTRCRVAGATSLIDDRVDIALATGADGPTALVRFGTQIGGMGDVDNDGIGDVYVGVASYSDVTRILSGRNGANFSFSTQFGHAVTALDDLDGDGIRELLIGDRSTSKAYVVSPTFPWGTILLYYSGAFGGQFFGEDVAALGDLDGDGVREYAIASRLDDQGFAAMVEVYSGATGVELSKIVSPDPATPLTPQVADAGDVNGDGVRDLALSGRWTDAQAVVHAATFLYSGATRLLLDRLESEDDSVVLDTAGDFDATGLDDVIVGSLGANYDGRVQILSGALLFLTPSPSHPVAGDILELATREGTPGKPTVVVVEAVDGAPTFFVVGGVATFGPLGDRKFGTTVPSGLAGHSVTLRAYANSARNKVIRSALKDVSF